jgi:hypothetical protein
MNWRRKMKNLKKLLTATTLFILLIVSASSAKAGLLVSDLVDNNPQPCIETSKDSKLDWGIVVTGFTGIVVTGFTGIVITGAVDTPVDCGILMSD